MCVYSLDYLQQDKKKEGSTIYFYLMRSASWTETLSHDKILAKYFWFKTPASFYVVVNNLTLYMKHNNILMSTGEVP